MNAFKNKKKIRGWKRRVRALDNWGEEIMYTNASVYSQSDYHYCKCIIAPFYRLSKRQPPLWFFRIIVGKLINAFEKWQEDHKGFERPYDLQLRIFDPHFIMSEIRRTNATSQGELYNYFPEMERQYPFPFEKFATGNINKLKKLEWVRCGEERYIDEFDIDEGFFKLDKILQEGYEKQVAKNGEIYYSKIIGDVWVGRYKA